MKGLWAALGFLTTVPVKVPVPGDGDLGRAAMWFPLVGLGLGGVLALAHLLLAESFPPLVAASLVVALWALLTGGLHLDGLADSLDGLLAAAPPRRRLEIMRDPRLGTFGASGLILVLLLKVHAVASLAPGSVPDGVAALWSSPLVVSAVLARWIVLLVALQRPARPGGAGASFAQGLKPGVLVAAAVVPLAVVVVGDGRTFFAALLAHAIAVAVIVVARRRLGGVSGDVLGLAVELAEVAVITSFSLRGEFETSG